MLTKIVIIGASGFGREVLWTLHDCNEKLKRYEILGFIDEDELLNGKSVNGFPILGGLDWFLTKDAKDVECVIAISDPKTRKNILNKLEKQKVSFATIIHPSVIHSDFVQIGKGTIIQAGCIITVNVKIGNYVHININSTIGHDSILQDFVTINPGVIVNGNSVIHTGVNVGTGTIMKQMIIIGKWSIIGAGTVLIENVPELSMFLGVPGKLKKELEP
mgnify:FL=1|jgi:sugar O-acyltransferase (sialic acid O-acetyltransferase NeuD family)